MSTKYLGETFDIHGGGIDLQFPHHEAEIAQNYGAFHQHPANYWMHNNMITINGQKMSRSLNNFITLEQLFAGEHERLEQAYSPMTVRFFMLQAHYRSPLDFSNEALQAAEKGFKRLSNAQELLDKLTYQSGAIDQAIDQQIRDLCDDCYRRMSDDFSTAQTIAVLFELSNKINALSHGQLPIESLSEETFGYLNETFTLFTHQVLGLTPEANNDTQQLDAVIQLLIDMRQKARRDKDFATSDQIRDRLAEIGVQLKDGAEGTTYVK